MERVCKGCDRRLGIGGVENGKIFTDIARTDSL